jgi:arylsulfatase A-like enzyme
MDLAPTILTLFGVEVPGHMNGKVLEVDTSMQASSRAAA